MMTPLEKYESVFMQAFNLEQAQLPGLVYQSIPEWDSLGHFVLISTLEATFGIIINSDDVTVLNSFEAGKDILKKYNIAL